MLEELLDLREGLAHQRLHGDETRLHAIFGDREDRAFRFVQDQVGFLVGFVRRAENLVRREDQVTQRRLFLDDLRVVFDVGRARHAIDERRDVGRAADFLEVTLEEDGTGEGGYAKEMGEQQNELIRQTIAARLPNIDVVISTASIPGRKAPVLLNEDGLKKLKTGSVVVDLAVEQGGNCPLTERDAIVVKHGVTLVGYCNLPAMLAAGHALASQVFGRPFGSFRPGAPADLTILAYDAPTPLTSANVLGHFLFGMHARMVRDVMVNGTWVVRDARLTAIDPEALARRTRRAAARLWKAMERIRA